MLESGIGARITLDRSHAQVGDPIGVTVEVETPPGFTVQTPAAPGDGAFASDSVTVVEPIGTDTGLRHHLLWIVRAREVGEHALPWLEVPLVRPDGAVRPIRVGGVPLSVLSVRADLPEREAVFDIRTAPPIAPTPLWVFGVGAAGILLVLLGVRAVRRRARTLREATTKLEGSARTALSELADPESSTDARAFASRVRNALVDFVSGVWSFDASSATPAELPAMVDLELVNILQSLELARFEKRPTLAPLASLASRARERVRHVAGLRA